MLTNIKSLITKTMKKTLILLFLLLIFFEVKTQNELWGMTTDGGDGLGAIFKMDATGNNQTVMYKFGENHGSYPCGSLFEATNGKLYGLTSNGGASNQGTLFEYDINSNTHVKKFDFNVMSGKNPFGSLIEVGNGKLYGLTNSGGTSNLGTLFEFDINLNTFTKKIDFNGTNGAKPFGSLLKCSNGKLYGLTSLGGINNTGILFEYNINLNSIVVKHNFSGVIDGENPYGSLTDGLNGKLYGLSGGDSSRIVFQFDTLTNLYTKIHTFNILGLYQPEQGDLVLGLNGKMYGTFPYINPSLEGVLFEINLTTDIVTTKKNFISNSSGSKPEGAMVQAANGKLYGLTKNGGSNNYGCLYEYDITGNTLLKKVDFTGIPNGFFPKGSMIKASNGRLYGMCSGGGLNGVGLIFEYDEITNVITNKVSFNGYKNGTNPFSDLFLASNSKFYGMTFSGGLNNFGVLFEFDPLTNIYTKKIDFGGVVGRFPSGALMEANNGKLYGYLSTGGTYGYGVLFEYDFNINSYTVKHNFNGYLGDGGSPGGKLIQAVDGKLYGLTPGGSGVGLGSLFTYDIVADTFIKKVTFNLSSTGNYPSGSLIQLPNGKMYGMTSHGGVNGLGTLFEYDPIFDIYSKKLILIIRMDIIPLEACFYLQMEKFMV